MRSFLRVISCCVVNFVKVYAISENFEKCAIGTNEKNIHRMSILLFIMFRLL